VPATSDWNCNYETKYSSLVLRDVSGVVTKSIKKAPWPVDYDAIFVVFTDKTVVNVSHYNLSLQLSSCHCVTLPPVPPCHHVTVSLGPRVTASPCHLVTVSLCHCAVTGGWDGRLVPAVLRLALGIPVPRPALHEPQILLGGHPPLLHQRVADTHTAATNQSPTTPRSTTLSPCLRTK